MQHHGDSRTAVPHPIVRARQKGAFPTESVLLQGGGKAAQNPLCWCKTQDKDYHSSARGPINFGKKAASCYCKAQPTCKLEEQSLKASQLLTALPSVPGEKTTVPKKAPSERTGFQSQQMPPPSKNYYFKLCALCSYPKIRPHLQVITPLSHFLLQ